MVVPFVGGAIGGALTVLALWFAGQALTSGDVAAELQSDPEPILSTIDAIAVVHQVRAEDTEDGPQTMLSLITEMCHPEPPDWRAVYSYGKWEVTVRCTALLASPVWLVSEPDLNVVPYTNAAGLLTR
jgi:hypothetical protein